LRAKIEADAADPKLLLSIHGEGYRLAMPAAGELVGRGSVRQALLDASNAHPVVVLHGPGGVGKSTLARVVHRPGDVWVDLGRCRTDAEVAPAVALALGSPVLPTWTDLACVAWAAAALGKAGGRTVVLDAAEGVADGVEA